MQDYDLADALNKLLSKVNDFAAGADTAADAMRARDAVAYIRAALLAVREVNDIRAVNEH